MPLCHSRVSNMLIPMLNLQGVQLHAYFNIYLEINKCIKIFTSWYGANFTQNSATLCTLLNTIKFIN